MCYDGHKDPLKLQRKNPHPHSEKNSTTIWLELISFRKRQSFYRSWSIVCAWYEISTFSRCIHVILLTSYKLPPFIVRKQLERSFIQQAQESSMKIFKDLSYIQLISNTMSFCVETNQSFWRYAINCCIMQEHRLCYFAD